MEEGNNEIGSVISEIEKMKFYLNSVYNRIGTLFFKLTFNWRIIALHYCVDVYQTLT